jgi:glycosyltransferase involved in cell wall biosynthesis
MKMPLRVTHIIGSLGVGGAEQVLCRLLSHSNPDEFRPQVATLTPGGVLQSKLEAVGVRVKSFDFKKSAGAVSQFAALVRYLRQQKPDVVVTWMYHSNLIGGLAARMAGELPVVWNIRNARLEKENIRRTTRLVARLGGALSRHLSEATVYVSRVGQQWHEDFGYSQSKSTVIPTGFDVRLFCPSAEHRRSVRDELGLGRDAVLVGLIGRYHRDKDHDNFLTAARQIAFARADVHFLLAGPGVDDRNQELGQAIAKAELQRTVHLLGCRSDMPRLQASLDLAVSASSSEAFPNVIGEAMSCGVPCVVTAVGDSSLLVGSTGLVVAPRDPTALASACLAALAWNADMRIRRSQLARRRIVEHFSLAPMLKRHEDVWRSVARGMPAAEMLSRESCNRAA